MFKTCNNSIRLTAILSLVLVFALSAAWAVQTYHRSKVIGKYGGIIPIHVDVEKRAVVAILPRALDDYFNEQGIDDVEITVEMIADEENGTLLFTFGPSGAYFDPPLKLALTGDYINHDMLLFDENGEAVEYDSYFDGEVLIFEIPHFSHYYYDGYY